jgi:hypothetical protein
MGDHLKKIELKGAWDFGLVTEKNGIKMVIIRKPFMTVSCYRRRYLLPRKAFFLIW